jgi:hypothetical protein
MPGLVATGTTDCALQWRALLASTFAIGSINQSINPFRPDRIGKISTPSQLLAFG